MDINNLREYYLNNVNNILPAVAKAKQWKIKYNHCFARIILDNLFGDCWYNHLNKNTTAYKQLNYNQLKKVFNIIQLILLDETGNVLYQLNNNSLKYRNKL